MNEDAIVAFFEELASASPIPVVIYNFPTVVAGLDLYADVLIKLGGHPNIVGVKLTCADIAKVSKIVTAHSPSEFSAIAGQSDWLIPAMTVGAIGAVTGVGNLYPRFCVQTYDLYKAGKVDESVAMQQMLAQMEWGFATSGINGVKWVVGELLGYSPAKCHCRRPYPQFNDVKKKRFWCNRSLRECGGNARAQLKSESLKKQAWLVDTVKPLLADESKMNSSPLLRQNSCNKP